MIKLNIYAMVMPDGEIKRNIRSPKTVDIHSAILIIAETVIAADKTMYTVFKDRYINNLQGTDENISINHAELMIKEHVVRAKAAAKFAATTLAGASKQVFTAQRDFSDPSTTIIKFPDGQVHRSRSIKNPDKIVEILGIVSKLTSYEITFLKGVLLPEML